MVRNIQDLNMIDPMHTFNLFMDSDKMLALLQQHLPKCASGEYALTECKIQHPRYKTYLRTDSRKKSFLALVYHLRTRNLRTLKIESQILYCKAYLGKYSYIEFLKAQHNAELNGRESLLYIADLGMLCWSFPHDPVMYWLPVLVALQPLQKRMALTLFFKQCNTYDSIHRVELSVINYRPEIRCTNRYIVYFSSGAQRIVFTKTFADTQQGKVIFHRMKKLWQRSLQKPNSFEMAEPLAYETGLCTIWLDGLQGNPLYNTLKTNNENQQALLQQIACGLADLHRVSLSALAVITPDAQLAEVRKKALKLVRTFPRLQYVLEKTITQLENSKPDPARISMRLIHGDFHLKQLLLLEHRRVALFDFDELALGDPLLDLANFCADLYDQAFEPHLIPEIITKLYKHYQTASGTDINAERFNWHLRIQLLTRAYRCYIQQKPDLELQLSRFIELAALESFSNIMEFQFSETTAIYKPAYANNNLNTHAITDTKFQLK